MRSMKRLAVSTGAVALSLVLATACTRSTTGGPNADGADSGASAEDTIRVGLLNPTTGVFAAIGSDTNTGFKMYLDERDGKLAGWNIETVEEDDRGDPATGGTKVRKLIGQDNADILVGGVSSAVAYGIADIVEESGLPYIITVAGADGLTQSSFKENIFRISYTGSQPMYPLGEYACKTLGYKTASVIALDYAFGWEAGGGFARTYEEAGCEVVEEVYVPLASEDYAPFVQQLSRDSDVVMHVNSGASGNLFWQAYADFGYSQPVIGHGTITDDFLLQNNDDFTVGAKTVFYWSRALDTEANQDFVEAYEEQTGTLVSQGSEAGYAAAAALEAALEHAGDKAKDPGVLVDALKNVTVDAPRGSFEFDEYNQAVMDFYLRETQKIDEDPFGNGKVNKANVVIDTFPQVSQFGPYDPKEHLAFPPYERLKGTWAD